MRFKIKLNSNDTQEIDARKMGDRLLISNSDGSTTEWEIVSQSNGEIVLARDGRLLRMAGHKRRNERFLWADGRSLRYERIEETAGDGPDEAVGSLAATIPAVVTEILVSVGDTVASGDKLILLESMKMVIPIQATLDGIVTEIRCSAGDSIQPGVPLIQLEAGENDER